jgi:ubiquinol-cytochrome c reductase iron-sulfur subunit
MRPERAPALAFVVAIVGALVAALVYALGGQPQLEGACLAIALGGIGIGLTLWAKRFLPLGPDVEERGSVASSPEDRAALRADFETGDPLSRRRVLAWLSGGSFVALVVALAFPIRSLGPAPGRGLKQTPWRRGVRLVTEQDEPVRDGEVAVGGVVTVYPEGFIGREDAQTLLLHIAPDSFTSTTSREGWNVGTQVAFSKVCTHAGCPVGLYQEELNELLCPCHQSTFAVDEGCRPIFGPATRALPQLPLEVDGDGYLMAGGDFSDPVGPGFWDRER